MAEENLKSKTKKGLYWKSAEQFSNYGIQFLIGIVMARLLSPSDYGITALPVVFMAIANIFATAGFGTAMVRKKDLKEEDLSTAFYYSTIVGIFCYVSLFFASPLIADFYNTPVLKPLMRVTALSFLYGPLGTPQNIILQRRLDFKTPTKIGVTTRILSGIVGIVLAFIGYGVWALVLSNLFSGVLSLILNWYVVRWIPKTGWSKKSFKYLWGYGNKLMGSQLLDTIYNNITPVVLGKFYSPAELGVYNRADGYAQLPSQNISGTIASVTFPVLSKIQDDLEKMREYYRKILRTEAFVIFPLMMGLAALARPLILVMITNKWESCILLLQIICFSKMWWPIHALNVNLLLIKGRSDLFLKIEFIKKIWGLSVMAITLPLGIVYFCSAGIISSIFSLAVNTYYTGKILNLGFFKQMKDIMPTLLLSFTMFAICIGITNLIENLFLQIIGGVIMGGIVYLGGAYILKFEELLNLKYLLNRN